MSIEAALGKLTIDRMLIAQATRRGLQLLSVDRRFNDYDIRLV